MNELCFVWGPPFSGQKRWMALASEESDPKVRTSFVLLDHGGGARQIEDILRSVEERIEQLEKIQGEAGGEPPAQHLYVELPWAAVYEDIVFDEWLASHSRFGDPLNPFENPHWNVSFVGLAPFDAERLPALYRQAMEEFARASNSAILVSSLEDQEVDLPFWLGSPILDFGPRIEVFAESLWPRESLFQGRGYNFAEDKSAQEEFINAIVPLTLDPAYYLGIMKDVANGKFGKVWGAEIFWKNEDGFFECLCFAEAQVFSWTSSHRELLEQCPLNGALLALSGYEINMSQLEKECDQGAFY